MCGRFTHKFTWREIWELYQLPGSVPSVELKASYNVAPTQMVPVVRLNNGEREGTLLRWGLIPFFAKGEPPKYSTINARAETIETAASYRGPWKRGQRCIMLSSGFYEWHVNEDGSKIPFFIRPADQEIFGFAALWDRSVKADGTAVDSATIVTMPANDMMAGIHNAPGKQRMPAILAIDDRDTWLSGTPEEARTALRQYPADVLSAWPVSTRVNSPKNNGPELVQPQTQSAGLTNGQ